MNKIATFTTDTLEVKWAHLHAPDDKFGADSANHNITIVVDETLQSRLDEMVKSSSATRINGLRTDEEGTTLLKVKSKAFVKKNVHTFPCRDAAAKRTDAVPFGGDQVKLRLSPTKLDRDDSLSIYLNGVQIIQKEVRDTGGFEPTDGFDGESFIPPIEDNTETPKADEIPF